MHLNTSFDFKKATQVINFFATKSEGNKMMIIKLIWAADRYHLRKYGRTITGDTYFAMKLGPVASGVKDISEESTFFEEDLEYSKKYIKRESEYTIKSISNPDMDVFSETDIEALNFAYSNFGNMDKFRFANEITHQYPEWMKFKEGFDNGSISRVKMNLLDFFENPDKENDPFSLNSRLLNSSKEEFEESTTLK